MKGVVETISYFKDMPLYIIKLIRSTELVSLKY